MDASWINAFQEVFNGIGIGLITNLTWDAIKPSFEKHHVPVSQKSLDALNKFLAERGIHSGLKIEMIWNSTKKGDIVAVKWDTGNPAFQNLLNQPTNILMKNNYAESWNVIWVDMTVSRPMELKHRLDIQNDGMRVIFNPSSDVKITFGG